MSRNLMRIKGLLLATLMVALTAGCASAPANEIPNTPNEVQEISAVSEQDIEQESTSDETEAAISETDLVNTEQQIVDAIEITLDDLTSYQLELFKVTSTSFVDNIKDGTMTIEDVTLAHSLTIDDYILMNELPQNARQLFNEWKESVGYYEKLTAWINETDMISTDEIIEPDYSKVDSGVEVTQQTNKPQSSESQVKEQAKDAQERVSGSTEQVVILTPNGEISNNSRTAEEATGQSFEDMLIEAIIAREGISYAEAQAKAQEIMANSN